MKKLILNLLFIICSVVGYAQMPNYWVPTSGTDTYTTNVLNFGSSYANKIAFVKFGNTNTTTATLQINSIASPPALRMWDGDSWEPLTAGQIDVNTVYKVAYNGSYWQMESFGTGGGGGGTWGSITGTLSDQTDLQSALDAKVATTRTISTTSPLSGGGDLSTNRTLSISDAAADGSTKGAASFTAADFNATSGNISIDYTNATSASESQKAFIELATQAETDGFTDDARAVTPLKLHTNLKRRSTKTANYSIVASDVGSTILANPSSTITFTIDQLAADDYVTVLNKGTANVSFAAGSGLSLSGISTLAPGLTALVYWDASNAAIIYGGSTETGGLSVLYKNTNAVANSGTSDTDLYSYTMPAGTLFTDGESIEGEAAGTFAATANNKRIKVKLGATTVFDSGALAITTATDWSITFTIIRVSDTSQKCVGTLRLSNSTTQSFTDYSTATETLSVSNTVKVTGTGGASSDISAEFTKIKKVGY